MEEYINPVAECDLLVYITGSWSGKVWCAEAVGSGLPAQCALCCQTQPPTERISRYHFTLKGGILQACVTQLVRGCFRFLPLFKVQLFLPGWGG